MPVVQLDHDEETRLMHGMHGTVDAELSWTAFLCLFRRVIGPTTAHVDNKGTIEGLWSVEMKCIGPISKDADLWALICEEVRRSHQGGVQLEVEHVKASPTEGERFVTEGNERADEMARDGATLDGGEMAQMRATTVQQKGEEVHAALQYAASFHRSVEEWHDCAELKPRTKEELIFVDENVEAKKHRTEWCAATTRYRCMRRGRNI